MAHNGGLSSRAPNILRALVRICAHVSVSGNLLLRTIVEVQTALNLSWGSKKFTKGCAISHFRGPKLSEVEFLTYKRRTDSCTESL